jgi:hypothetical protein
VQTQADGGGRLSSASLSNCEWAQAASAAFHSSVIVALHSAYLPPHDAALPVQPEALAAPHD